MNDFKKKQIAFSFRILYQTQNEDEQVIVYTRSEKKSPEQIHMLHSKSGFSRTLNGYQITLFDYLA
tara:strand:- start:34 stop:231 length:198 start_codon:yes stop_codon:yes gene_type:complete